MDIFLAIVQAVVALAMAYLGVHLTLHPPGESTRTKSAYKAGFIVCGIVSVALIGVQTHRNGDAQKALRNQLARIEGNTKTPPIVQVNVPPATVVFSDSRRDLKTDAPKKPRVANFELID